MEHSQKIPVIFLLKASRQECGALKSYIQELEDKLKEKDEIILKQKKQIKSLQKAECLSSASKQVDKHINDILATRRRIDEAPEYKRNGRKVQLYKRMAKCYNTWYSGCKVLIPLMDELVHPSKYENPKPSSETTT